MRGKKNHINQRYIADTVLWTSQNLLQKLIKTLRSKLYYTTVYEQLA